MEGWLTVLRIDEIYACKVELTEEGWRFYFFSQDSDVEITVLNDFSLRIRQERPKDE